MADDARPTARLKLAHFGPLPPAPSPLARWGAALVSELARHADVGVFVEGCTPDGRVPASVRIHDLAMVHWRNALFAYDLAIYEVADDGTADFAHDALCDWPGVVVLHGDDPQPLFARAPRLRRAVLEHPLALVVLSPSLRSHLSASEPWTSLHVLENHPEPVFETIATELIAICTAALAGRRGLVEEVLETACAEMPIVAPGDVSAPWRAEVDELSSLGALSTSSREGSAPAPGRMNRNR